MKKKIMKVLSVMLAVVLTLTAAPLSGFIGVELPEWLDASIEAEAATNYTYNPDEAVAYAKAHYNDGKGLCAEFVSDCLKAGGFTAVYNTRARDLGRQLQEYGKKISCSGWSSSSCLKASMFNGELSKGDVIIWENVSSSSSTGHAMLYSGKTNSKGQILVYAHNRAKNEEVIMPSSSASTVYAIHLSSTGQNNYTYSFNFNANGGTLGNSGAFSVKFGEDFQILNTTCTRSGYTWAGWNVKRNNDNKWYVSGQGWCTESEISSNSYIKKVYSNYETKTLDNSWINGISGNGSYTFYAVWIQSRKSQLNVFFSPYGEGFDHITAMNASASSGYAQNYIYAWYILYDANTGDLLNTYTDLNYNVCMQITKPNGETYEPTNYQNADANWVGFTPVMSGEYTITVTVTGGVSGSYSTKYTVFYDTELLASTGSVSLNLNGTNTKTIEFTPAGSYPGSKGYTANLDSSIASITEHYWSGEKFYFTIKGNKVGSTTLSVKLYENYSGNKNVVATIDIPVTVTANTYTIHYNANGGSGLPSSQTKYYGTDITLSTTKPTRTGYTFLGWSTSSTATSATYQPGAMFSSNANTTLYAVWKANTYTIKYNANGGSGTMSNSSHTYDISKALTSNAFTRSGYTFLGWSTSSTATSATYTDGQSVKNLTPTNGGTVNLYAVWKANPTYTLSYNANGGSGAPTSQTGSSNYTVSSTVPTRFGYTFLGWSTVSIATNATYESGDSITINANTTLYAVWKPATALSVNTQYSANISFSNQEVYYTFTPFSNGEYTFESTGSVDSRVYVYNTSGTEIGYDDDSSAEGTNFKLSLNLTAGTKYYIKVRAYNNYIGTISFKITGKYTISYNANGGSGVPSSQTKIDGTVLTLSTTKPTRTGYTFLGWSTSSSATSATYSAGGNFTTNANTTLYAVWKANTYTVKYNANGGSGTMSDSNHTYDVSKTLTSNAFTRTGYTFLGWSTSSTATSATYTNGQSVKNLTSTNGGTVNLYAVWSKLPTYTIEYNGNGVGGLVPASQIKTHGEALTLSKVGMSRTGYTFLGWSTSSTATSATYQPGDSFTTNADTTLYAVWKANTYTVKYNANGGTGTMSDSSHTYDVSKALTSNAFTRSGYTFLGWATSSTATSAIYTDGQSVKNLTSTNGGTINLYAVWKLETSELSVNTTNNAVISSGGEMKYYTFTPTTSGIYVIYSTGSEDTKVFLYNSTGTQIDSDDDDGDGNNFRLECELTAGTTYRFGVKYYNSSKTGTIPFVFGHVYTVSYNANGGSGAPSSQSKDFGKAITLSNTVPTRTGYTFLGWSTNSAATRATYQPGDSFTTEANTTLYAVWHTHTYMLVHELGASCTTDGSKTYGCTGCSHSYTETVPATGHTWTAATCTAKKTCSTCGTTSGSALGHSYTSTVTKAATCTTAGTETHTCSRCSHSYAETIPATGHTWTAATCTSAKKCSVCNTTSGSALSHSYTSTVTKAATCTTTGTETHTCSRCSHSYAETIPATGHTWTAATCTSAKKCSVCNVTSGSALGHSYTSTVTKAATCTTAGTETHTCSRCSHSYTITIPATGHTSGNIVVENSTAATCGQAGSYDEVIYCVLCDEELSRERKTVNALPHSYNNRVVTKEASCTESGTIVYTCTLCNDSFTEEIEALGHNYSSAYTIDIEAGCTTNGSKSQHCSRCNSKTNVTTIPAFGHTYGAWIIIIEPGCTSNGAQKHTCETCGNEQVEVVSATGHNYSTVVTAPTCTAKGYTTYTCSCGDTYIDDYVDATGEHQYSPRKGNDPTCTEDGFVEYCCDVCESAKYTEIIPATGHNYIGGICKKCGEKESHVPDTPEYNYTFSIQTPSTTTIRHKDGIILHADIEGIAPDGCCVEWTSSNNNFKETVQEDGNELKIISDKNGYTTFTATLYDADGNVLTTDTIEMRSKAGFFDKIGSFFRGLFGGTKVYEY